MRLCKGKADFRANGIDAGLRTFFAVPAEARFVSISRAPAADNGIGARLDNGEPGVTTTLLRWCLATMLGALALAKTRWRNWILAAAGGRHRLDRGCPWAAESTPGDQRRVRRADRRRGANGITSSKWHHQHQHRLGHPPRPPCRSARRPFRLLNRGHSIHRGRSLGTITKAPISKDGMSDMMAGGTEMQRMVAKLDGTVI